MPRQLLVNLKKGTPSSARLVRIASQGEPAQGVGTRLAASGASSHSAAVCGTSLRPGPSGAPVGTRMEWNRSPARPENVLEVDADGDPIGGDDTADALRYLVATKARKVRVRKLSGV